MRTRYALLFFCGLLMMSAPAFSQAVDLSLTKAVSTGPYSIGQTVTYTVTITNNSTTTEATNVSVREVLHSDLTYGTSSDFMYDVASRTLTATVANLAAGASKTLVFTAIIDYGGSILSCAEIASSGQVDPNSTPGNGTANGEDDEACACITIPIILIQGQEYTITVDTYTGLMWFKNGIEITGTFPATEAVVNADGSLTIKSAGSYSFKRAGAGGCPVTGCCPIMVTMGTAVVDLSLTKTVSAGPYTVGQMVTYTIAVKNNSTTATGTNIAVEDVLHDDLTFGASTQFTYTSSTRTLSATVASIAPGATANLTFTATIAATGSILNCAQIKSTDQTDPNSTPGNGTANGEDDEACACITVPIYICAGEIYKVEAISGGSVKWYKNNIEITSVFPVAEAVVNADGSLDVKSAGSYSAKFSNTGGCPVTGCCPIVVLEAPIPVPSVTSNSPVCEGGVVNLNATGGGGGYAWSGPASYSSVIQNPTLTPAAVSMSGTYSLTVTATTTGSCTASATTSVSVIAKPVITTIDKSCDIGAGTGTITVNATGGTLEYQLDTNPFQDSNVFAGVATGSHSITVRVKNTQCAVSQAYSLDCGSVCVKPNAGPNQRICEPITTASLGAAGAGNAWSVLQPTPSSTNVSIDATTGNVSGMTAVGVYKFILIYTIGGSTCSDTVQVARLARPIPSATSNVPCVNQTLNLSATGGNSYAWSGPASFTSISQNPTVSNVEITNGGIYTVTVTNTSSGCSNTATTSVSINTDCFGSIGNFVWKDLNENGIQDATEPGVANVTVELYNLVNRSYVLSASTTTDANGAYLFGNLSTGDYKVKFVYTNPDCVLTKATQGTDPGKDSDAGVDGFTPPIHINTTLPKGDLGRDNPTIDAGLIVSPKGSIGNFVWKDLNENGIQDATEPGVANVTVELYNLVNRSYVLSASTTTDANGAYLFGNLSTGDYKVKFVYTNPDCVLTKATQGTDSGKDSDAGVDGFTPPIHINTTLPKGDPGRDNPTIDAGLIVTPPCEKPVLSTTMPNICVGETTHIKAVSSGGAINWYYAEVGGVPFDTSLSGAEIGVTPTTTTTYYAEIASRPGIKCKPQRASITITVYEKPQTPVCNGIATNKCPETTVDLTKLSVSPISTQGGIFEWHTGLLATSPLVANPAAVVAGTYYLFEKSIHGCYSNPTVKVVNITNCECTNVATANAGSDQSMCYGSIVLLKGIIGGSATQAVWSSNGTGSFGNVNGLATYYTPSENDWKIGYVTLTLTTIDTNPTDNCGTVLDATVITLNPIPQTPFGLTCGDDIICVGTTVRLIGYSPGNTIRWYSAATGGTLLGVSNSGGYINITPTITTIYYAEAESPNGCKNPVRVPITATVAECKTDLGVVKSVLTPGPYKKGQTIVYSIAVNNLGKKQANDVKVSDVLPSTLTYINSVPVGEYNSVSGVWTIGSMAGYSNRLLQITATINAESVITNTAIVSSPDNDPDKRDNDTSRVTISSIPVADLSLKKTVSKSIVKIGDVIIYQLEVRNDGPDAATNVEVKDVLPSGVTFMSSSSLINNGGILTGKIAKIDVGTTATFSFTAQVTSKGSITNSAEISKSDQKDPDSTPNNGTNNGEDDTDKVTITATDPCDDVHIAIGIDGNSGSTILCLGSSIKLIATGCNGTITWSNGSTGANITVSPTVTTTYTATCKTVDCPRGVTTSEGVTITVQPKPDYPVITCGDKETCPGQRVALTAVGCDGIVEWSNGAKGSTIIVNPTITTAYYAYCVIGNCRSERSVDYTVVVTQPKAPTLSASKNTVCIGESVVLSAIGCDGTVKWSDGSTGSTITVTLSATTTYTATCTKINCSESVPSTGLTITVQPTPELPVISANKSQICPSESVILTATGCNGSVVWSNGSTGATITVNPTITTSYSAYCMVGSCKSKNSSDYNIVVVLPQPPVISANTTVVCVGSSVSLVATGCNGTITWSNGSTGANITVSPTVTTTYTATCKPANCSESASSTGVTITVQPKPEPPIIGCGKTEICPGEKVTLVGTGCNGIIEWSNGATGNTVVVTPMESTAYYAYCVVGNCKSTKATDVVLVVGKPQTPVLTVSKTTICSSETVNISATGCNGTVVWSNGLTGGVITQKLTSTTTFTATCKSGDCAGDMASITIAVQQSPSKPQITDLVNDCPETTVDLTKAVRNQPSTGGVFEFHTGNTPTSPLVSNPKAVDKTGTYYVFEKSASGCFSDPCAINVLIVKCPEIPECVKNPATANAGIDATTCVKQSYKLNGKIGGSATSGRWTSSGTGSFDNPLSLTATYFPSLEDLINGSVTLTLTTNDPDGTGECVGTSDTMILTINGVKIMPAVLVEGNTNICNGDSVKLTVQQIGYGYKWNTGETTQTIWAKDEGDYIVHLVDANGCGSLNCEPITIKYNNVATAPKTVAISNVLPAKTVNLAGGVTSTPQTVGGVFEYHTGTSPSSPKIVNYQAITASGTYYVFEKATTGCFTNAGIIAVTINTTPPVVDKNADLRMTMSSDKDTIFVGEQVVQTIVVKNIGPDVATNILIEDILPAGLTYVGMVIASDSARTFTDTNGKISVKLSSLVVGDSLIITIKAKVTQVGSILNIATINNFDQRKDGGTYYASRNATVIGKAVPPSTMKTSLGVAMAVKDVALQSDGTVNVTYSVVAKNYGSSTLTNIVLIDSLTKVFPSNVAYTIVGAVKANAGSSLAVNSAYNGKTDTRLILASSTLTTGKADTVTFVLNLKVTGTLDNTPIYNSVIGTAKDGSDVVADVSMSGTNPDPNGNNDPTEASEKQATPLVLVLSGSNGRFYIPEGFSPNGDGINDNFEIINTKGELDISLKIYDSAGMLVYANNNYKNEWKGESNQGVVVANNRNGGLPDGTYFYVVRLSDNTVFVRYITIMR